MLLTMPRIPRELITRLNTAGFDAYAVGGAVRDTLLGRTPDDWDITTNATPAQTAQTFADCHCILTGAKHGTVTVVYDGMPIEITTYRVDGTYADNRHPNRVSFTSSLQEDLLRRDFTVNTLVWHPDTGILDYTDGMQDLKMRTLRCVGDPQTRFREDALRILRALRFAATYGFHIEPVTADAIHKTAHLLRNVAIERIYAELTRLLCGEHVATVLSDFADVLTVIFPHLASMPSDLPQKIADAPQDTACKLACLLSPVPHLATDILHALKTDTHTKERTKRFLQYLVTPFPTENIRYFLKTVLRECGEADTRLCLALCKADTATLDTLIAENACYKIADLTVNGNDIAALGFCGADIGNVLEYLLQAVMRETCGNTSQALLTLAKTYKSNP